jgi:hypothetical protein
MSEVEPKIQQHVLTDGTIEYTLNGVLHNPEGPAMVSPDGTKAYFLFGDLHRQDGPAITSPDGFNAFFMGGIRHNPIGPAITMPDGTQIFFYLGYQATDEVIFNSDVWRKEIRAMFDGATGDDEKFEAQFDEQYIDKEV